MLEEIEAHQPGDAVAGAALMGVSPRTFRDWCKAIPGRPAAAPATATVR